MASIASFERLACDCLDSLGAANLPRNVGQTERLASVAAAPGLLALGLRECYSLRGLLVGGVGAGLLYRGLTGHCHLYEALGTSTCETGCQEAPTKCNMQNTAPARGEAGKGEADRHEKGGGMNRFYFA